MYRLIVAGSRDFNNYTLLSETLDEFLNSLSVHASLVCGKAKGADALGERYAKEHGMRIDYFPADWRRHGRGAGFIRNDLMAANADGLIAFWDGRSPGTKHLINSAKARGLMVQVVNY